MYRKIRRVAALLLLLLLLSGCSGGSQGKKDTQPGILETSAGTCYVVCMPNTFTTFEGREDGIFIVDHATGSRPSVAVYFKTLGNGDHVVYMENSKIIMYVPSTVATSSMGQYCAKLYANQNNYMSLEDAKKYVPWLAGQ